MIATSASKVNSSSTILDIFDALTCRFLHQPLDRANNIAGWRRELDYGSDKKGEAWGLTVDKEMMKVPARVLPAPRRKSF